MSLYKKEIRGEVNSEITNESASNLGSIIGNFLSPESIVNVGRDDKTASQMISRALIAGIMATGKTVADYGVVPTPVVHYHTDFLNGNLLITINTHHNVLSINIYSNYEIHLDQKQPEKVLGEDIGLLKSINEFLEIYQLGLNEQINYKNISTKKPKIIVECSDKIVNSFISQLLSTFGIETIVLNIENPNGNKERKFLENYPENISIVSNMVKTISADLGIILDNNGEQAFYIDEKGDLIRDQTILSIFAKHLLKKQKGLVISSIVASLALDEVVKSSGGKLIKTPVDAILKELDNPDVIFAGDEPGKYIFPKFQSCSDAIFASIKLIDIICAEDKPLSRLTEEIPEYHRTGFSVKCDHELKSQAIELLKNELKQKGKLTTVDGVRVDFDNSYILIRASCFEPILKIYLEAKKPERLSPLTREVNKIMDLIES
jgi:phosphomannomutase